MCRPDDLNYRSIDPHLPFPSTPYLLGAVGPKVGHKLGANCNIRPQWPRNRCIQFLLQKCEIDVILSVMSWHARPTPSGLHHPGHPSKLGIPLNLNNWLPWQRPSSPLDPHLTHDSLCLFESTAQTANRSVQPFLHSSQQKVPILYNGGPFPPKLPLLVGMGTLPHLFRDFLTQTEPTVQTASRSVRLFSHR